MTQRLEVNEEKIYKRQNSFDLLTPDDAIDPQTLNILNY